MLNSALISADKNVFWFAFAVGVMGAMLFPIIALVVYLPVFFPSGKKRENPAG